MTKQPETYKVGTLKYTGRALAILFAWLLWGDFCFTLMEAVVPAILPLKLKSLGAPNWVMGMIMTTLPGILNMTICPWVSFRSDRYRSKWGRRIPFILGTLPMLCLSLLAIGWTDQISALLHTWLPLLHGIAPATLTIVVMGVFMVSFSFFNMYVNSVFWYLFNDVVPVNLLGRFFGLIRIVGTAAGAGFNMFVFKYADTHFREIFTGAALLYAVGFGLMCLRVKEGEYPPPPEAPTGNPIAKFIAEIKSYGKESFSHRFYWYFYMYQTCMCMAGAVGIYTVFFYKEMGLDLGQIGTLNAVGSIAGIAAMYIAAVYVDKWHPLRITVYLSIYSLASMLSGGWLWIMITVPGIMFFWLNIAGGFVGLFTGAISGNTSLPLFMRLLPPSRYGQFCSANSLVRSAGVIVGGLLAGVYLDFVKNFFNGSDFAYRFLNPWICFFSIGTVIFAVLLYREWKRLGGDEHYKAPAPWSEDGHENMSDGAPALDDRPKTLLLALNMYSVFCGLTLLSCLVFLFFFNRSGLYRAFWWYAYVFIPLIALMLGVWMMQARNVRRDIKTAEAGQKPKYGIPHYGIPIVMAIQLLLGQPIWWLQLAWSMRLGMEREIICFGVAATLGMPFQIIVLHVLRLIEREISS